jgi:arylsulfatase A-like enzyme
LILFGEQAPWKGLRIPNLVRTTDIFPTLVNGLFDVARAGPESMAHAGAGIPLPLPGLEREAGYEEAKELAYAENEPLGLSCVRSEQWKYVAGPEGDRLFHLVSDPGEQSNVIDRHPSTVEYLKETLVRIRSMRAEGDGAILEREHEETRRLLRAFGYLE